MRQLPLWRYGRAAAYKFARDRFLCAKAYLMLCDVLSSSCGISEQPEFAYGLSGKPFLKDHPDIHFNLSHCPRAVACIVADHPAGIDVESIQFDGEVARKVLSDAELHQVLTSPAPEVEFTKLWTKKEALLKKRGTGLADDLPGLLNGHTESLETTVFANDGFVMTIASGHEC